MLYSIHVSIFAKKKNMLDKLKQDLENANLAYDEFKKTHSTPTTISDKLAEFGFGTDVEIREMKLTQSELEEMKSLETRVKNALLKIKGMYTLIKKHK